MNCRTCLGCRRKAPAQDLLRVVVSPKGELVAGAGEPGRGAWLCRGSIACLDAAIQRRAFGRAFRMSASPSGTTALRALFEGQEAPMCEDVGPQPAAEQLNSPRIQDGD